ncbi:mannan-binding lectin [Sphingomonas sp. AOB5]|uniref:mannan-binding lectin n=1 Tax=Sphingomonas sp. AOB5 TaxID=3034017 RepID=UPI0023F79D93|nr:mannan-binding lectin [Sphingomonas sp. AOB5]MDF7777105.1 mannan-binding lectin [Sphingomonas sp. AOB5]
MARYLNGFAVVALLVAPAAHVQAQTTGRNVTAVMVDAGPNGQYVKQGRDTWAELDTRGRPIFQFRERARDDWSVYLVDEGRGVEIQLDIHRRKVTISNRGGPRRDLYNIIRFTHFGTTYPPTPVSPAVTRPPVDVRDRDVRDVRDREDRRPVEVGPIWNQRDAETKCRDKARELRGEWTGGWWTTQPGRMSVCEIEFRGGRGDGRWDRDDDWGRDGTRDVEVGPIWNQRDAETKCNNKAREIGADWTGAWATVRPNVSVCGMRRRGGNGQWGGQREVKREIEVGPIWNQNDAVAKCNAKARELRGEWTGGWWTTQPGRMSVCEVRFR